MQRQAAAAGGLRPGGAVPAKSLLRDLYGRGQLLQQIFDFPHATTGALVDSERRFAGAASPSIAAR